MNVDQQTDKEAGDNRQEHKARQYICTIGLPTKIW